MVNAGCNEPRLFKISLRDCNRQQRTPGLLQLASQQKLRGMLSHKSTLINSAFSYDLPKYLNQTTSGRDHS